MDQTGVQYLIRWRDTEQETRVRTYHEAMDKVKRRYAGSFCKIGQLDRIGDRQLIWHGGRAVAGIYLVDAQFEEPVDELSTPERMAVEILNWALDHDPMAILIGSVRANEVAALAARSIDTCPECGAIAWVNIDCDLCCICSALTGKNVHNVTDFQGLWSQKRINGLRNE